MIAGCRNRCVPYWITAVAPFAKLGKAHREQRVLPAPSSALRAPSPAGGRRQRACVILPVLHDESMPAELGAMPHLAS
ncbi:hypothetical protein XAP7430_400211 [Xanthomonas phaseoli pv. phaseoli]|uniref:Uncharacterized protein n=1 Tax=Xanthomonas campestris pv. phaseoli TaxID=317013 RepID=A0AB38E0Z5_XANCH|nr:hypothetical protein XAP6984_430001 [Xanthomonas phaseoli pv. phaseoli]SON89153.1 hypothetical protein XAP7430_400211 [Xanthomonas phaseoli pv. phaseoli]